MASGHSDPVDPVEPVEPAAGWPAPVTRVVPARVGLVGNPSDGYGGAVLATVVSGLAATVSAQVATDVSFEGGGHLERWPSMSAWRTDVGERGHVGEQRIIGAALGALVDHLATSGSPGSSGTSGSGIQLRWSTTVPRSVGLAGSSALAVGVIDAAAAAWGITLDRRVIAALALRAEREGLGITAGWQDRIVQSCGCTVLVDASRMELVDGLLVPAVATPTIPREPGNGWNMELIVGWSTATATSSDDYHAPLRRQATELAAPMATLADLARRAADALGRGDAEALMAAIDATWRVRQSCAPLRADHTSIVEAVRATGSAATTPGSGGAVVAACADETAARRVLESLDSIGCRWRRIDLT